MDTAQTTGLLALGGVALGATLGIVGERMRIRAGRRDRLRDERRDAYSRFLADALLVIHESALLAGARPPSGLLGLIASQALDKADLKMSLLRLGEATAQLQIVGSEEVCTTALSMHLFVNGAVRAAEAKPPDDSYFDDLAEWRALRETFLAAARTDLDLPSPAWPALERSGA